MTASGKGAGPEINGDNQQQYDAQNPRALRELVAAGTKFLPFPQAVMEACFNAANELYAETIAKNPKFKKIYDSWKKFRDEQIQWFAVAENRYDNFMQAARTAAAKGGPK